MLLNVQQLCFLAFFVDGIKFQLNRMINAAFFMNLHLLLVELYYISKIIQQNHLKLEIKLIGSVHETQQLCINRVTYCTVQSS